MRILYLQYTNPCAYPPLEHSSRILAAAGWDVLFLGVHIAGVENLAFPEHPRVRLRWLGPTGTGWRQKLHYLRYCAWVFYWCVRFRAKWIYASDLLACPPALLLRTLGTRTLYHEHDSPTESPGWVQKWLRRSRRRLAKRAELCVLPNAQRRELFLKETGRTKVTQVVWNCPSKEEIADATAAKPEGFRIVYHGSFSPARLPLALLEAVQSLPAVELFITGYVPQGNEDYYQQWKTRIASHGLQARVHLLGTVPLREHLFARLQSASAGLCLMPATTADLNERYMAGASNKAFDYLTCSVPFLVNDEAPWKIAFVEPGYALACDPTRAESIANALKWFLDHPAERAEMGRKGRERCLQEWNYDSQFSPVLTILSLSR